MDLRFVVQLSAPSTTQHIHEGEERMRVLSHFFSRHLPPLLLVKSDGGGPRDRALSGPIRFCAQKFQAPSESDCSGQRTKGGTDPFFLLRNDDWRIKVVEKNRVLHVR